MTGSEFRKPGTRAAKAALLGEWAQSFLFSPSETAQPVYALCMSHAEPLHGSWGMSSCWLFSWEFGVCFVICSRFIVWHHGEAGKGMASIRTTLWMIVGARFWTWIWTCWYGEELPWEDLGAASGILSSVMITAYVSCRHFIHLTKISQHNFSIVTLFLEYHSVSALYIWLLR